MTPETIRRQAAWIRCDLCEDFFCTIHDEHVADCPYPGIEEWADMGIDPYSEKPPSP